MSEPYYADDTVTLYHGDCIEVLGELPDASVDAVVTDPPYGLEFMGREWDSFGREGAASKATAGIMGGGHSATNGRPSFLGGLNPRCLACGRSQRGGSPCSCESPRFTDERGPRLRAFQQWCEAWAVECLRVLKPGGHLLAFGGTRTVHRLTCAVEDAGFEIRDGIDWIYASGFPKSLDVSKAIDRRRDDRNAALAVAAWLAVERDRAGWTNQRIDALFGFSGMAGHWTARPDMKICHVPQWGQWLRLKDALGFGDEMDAEVWRLNGRKGKPGEAWSEREVIGERTTGIGTGRGAVAYINDSDNRDLTAPATAASRRWSGWGTALKPSHEPVVHAVKPYTYQQILDRIGSQLDDLEAVWQAPAADPKTPTGAAAGSAGPTATSPSELATHTNWSIASSWRRCWVDLCSQPSTSTTATTSSTTTDLKTLSYLLAQIMHASITPGRTSADGLRSLVEAADNLFAAEVLHSRATLALSVVGSATGGTPTSRRDAAARADLAREPIVMARKPPAGTVAANVLAYGTGALNIDACRVAAGQDYRDKCASVVGPDSNRNGDAYGEWTGVREDSAHAAGRWPSNIVFSHAPDCNGACVPGCPVGELDRQSGGEGGASRFFPVFRYEAKAPTLERPRADGVAHPTVKPLDLMRWLVRLVTPPGGVVLEPFAGSGTTAEACVVEGFRCIAIEREADYLPLIVGRLSKPLQAVLPIGATS